MITKVLGLEYGLSLVLKAEWLEHFDISNLRSRKF